MLVPAYPAISPVSTFAELARPAMSELE